MSSPAQDVRRGVARAERLRRGRATSQRLWFAAPIGAAVCAGLAAGVRWSGWPVALPLAAGGAGLAALAAYLYYSRHERAVTDAAALEIDARAALGGELRSANWFAAGDGHDEWVDFHLGRAAQRLEAVEWTALYPPVRPRRAQAATAILAIVAVVLVLPAAGRAGIQAIGAAGSGALPDSRLSGILPPDLRQLLEDVLKRAEESSLAKNGRSLTEAEVRDLLAKLAQARDLRDAKDGNRDPDADAKQLGLQGKELQELAERLKRASEISSLSPEVRDALAEAAEKLSDMADSQPSSPKDPKGAVGAANAEQGDAAQAKKGGNEYDDSSIKSVKDASAGGGIGVMMTASDSPEGAQEAGLGLGGASARNKGGGVMPDLGAALRKETVEAHQEDVGEKTTMDLRRKTERGTATIGYASTSAAAFEKGRATAPPAVPENRRAAVQTYFIRKQ